MEDKDLAFKNLNVFVDIKHKKHVEKFDEFIKTLTN
jgi:hypothetical protein